MELQFVLGGPTIMSSDGTILVRQLRAGDPRAADRLMPLIYDELRRLARRYLQDVRASVTLQPTILVHEAYCKLVDQDIADPEGRTHFFALAAVAMRQVMIDHLRHRKREKRGGGRQRVPLSFVGDPIGEEPLDALALAESLGRLAELDPRAAQVVQLRFFGGLTEAEIATQFGVTDRTIRNDWRMARAWLRRELGDVEQ